ncbi:hypothetical protein [Aquimarina sp. 2201CG5-10]|uniref:hypothetical protein n=1 Tax=Aquimarina callyspongiae TaxID=3098150 RepID=UPI002AB54C15|nr:hypothetical protein [Aquimarina sp. 2201CG5-10]MDY8138914.1 hypothetical protein [Aquimarina sp. 2201CG5-10]
MKSTIMKLYNIVSNNIPKSLYSKDFLRYIGSNVNLLSKEDKFRYYNLIVIGVFTFLIGGYFLIAFSFLNEASDDAFMMNDNDSKVIIGDEHSLTSLLLISHKKHRNDSHTESFNTVKLPYKEDYKIEKGFLSLQKNFSLEGYLYREDIVYFWSSTNSTITLS